MKALSIQQPWAWLIVNGYKSVENRGWPTNVRGRIAIHAGKKIDQEGWEWIHQRFPDIAIPDDLPLGGIVGTVTLGDCVTDAANPWFFGPYGFLLAQPAPVPLIPLRGQLGFFDVPPALLSQLGVTEEAQHG